MRIAVTGKAGQVARALLERAGLEPDLEVVCIGRPEFDLLRPENFTALLDQEPSDLVVSAAALTNVDAAEADPDAAFAINAAGPEALARATAARNMPIIHISTDYVFDGDGIHSHPYVEADPPNPVNVYGRSKLAGEEAVRAANPRHLILRTSWVYSPFGRNFATLTFERSRAVTTIEVPGDQTGSPTSALVLAEAIVVAARAALRPGFGGWGVYHLAGTGSATRVELARRIIDVDARRGGPHVDVACAPVSSAPRVPRPKRSHLNSQKFAETFGWAMPNWGEQVAPVVERLRAAK